MKFVRKLLPWILLGAMCLSFSSCGLSGNKYADLRDHVRDTVGVGKGLNMTTSNSKTQVFLYLQAPKTEEDKAPVDQEPLYLSCITNAASDGRYTHRVNLLLEGNDSIAWEWRYSDTKEHRLVMKASATISAAAYTGLDPIVGEIEYMTSAETDAATEGETAGDAISKEEIEANIHKYAGELTALSLQVLDIYCQTKLGYSIDALGFTALDKKYRYSASGSAALPAPLPLSADYMTLSTESGVAVPSESTTESATTETEEDLGGAFSMERISYSIRMTLMGMGMVFAVLILLWLILLVFKNVLGEKKPRAPKVEVEEPAPAPAPAPVAPVGDDPAVIAAITAAVAAMIESDADLSAQFIGGFRVVSFQKRSGKTSWNH